MERNATGCIGVIISINNPQSIIDVSESDCGSIECDNGERTTYSQKTLTISDIESSIENRSVDSYNEWVVQDYNIIGILALSPFEISTFKKSPCPDGVPEHLWNDQPIAAIESLSMDDVISEFSDHQVYSFCDGEIVKIVKNQIEMVNHNELYV
ncbi:TPA: hypothetical protein N2965_004580 [Vibrio parahaemolyticus]|nr:hypothetical protein [Vibrio parahaemolyticus]